MEPRAEACATLELVVQCQVDRGTAAPEPPSDRCGETWFPPWTDACTDTDWEGFNSVFRCELQCCLQPCEISDYFDCLEDAEMVPLTEGCSPD